jgi:uncharacterized membrane protein
MRLPIFILIAVAGTLGNTACSPADTEHAREEARQTAAKVEVESKHALREAEVDARKADRELTNDANKAREKTRRALDAPDDTNRH